MINVIVTRPNTATPITLKSSTGVVSGANRLDALIDVNATSESNNATLVYQANTDTYVVKQIDLDGGIF